MKRILFLGLLLTLISFTAWAQYYIRGGIGYGLSLGSQHIATSTNTVSPIRTYDGLYGSFGQGFNLGAAFGMSVNSNIKGELGISNLIGKSFEEKDVSSGGTTTTTRQGKFFSFIPSVLITTQFHGVEPYARIGGIIAFPSFEIEESGEDNDKSEYSGNIAFGFGGGLGAAIPLQGNLSFYAELTFTNLSWGPEEEKYTNWPSGETGTIKLKESYNENEQNTDIMPSIPFGNVGINIGVILNFE